MGFAFFLDPIDLRLDRPLEWQVSWHMGTALGCVGAIRAEVCERAVTCLQREEAGWCPVARAQGSPPFFHSVVILKIALLRYNLCTIKFIL